ncbi:MAG: hypothetical protein ACRCU2_22545 [Planktothrix sp.]
MATKKQPTETTNQTTETTKETNHQTTSQIGLKPSEIRNDFRAKTLLEQGKIDAEKDARIYFQAYNQHLNSLIDRGTVALAKKRINDCQLYPDFEVVESAMIEEMKSFSPSEPTLFLPQ